MLHSDLSIEIIKLKDADLQLRDQLIAEGSLFDGYHPAMEQLHINNAQRLEAIIDQIGYPTKTKVGSEANEAAWLIIQHAISLPTFMKKCCALLQDAINDNEANAKHLAYLTDRIAVFSDQPQLYGTQYDWDDTGQMSPQAYDNIVLVNERRKSIGLISLEEQTKAMRLQAIEHNESPPNNIERRRQQYDLWRLKVGWIK